MAFIFGGNTGMSYEDIQRKRQVADSLLSNAMRPARNVGEGLAAIGAALAVRGIEKRTKAADEENRRAFNDQWGSIFGGGSPEVVTQAAYSQPEPVDPMDPQAIASDTMKALGKQTFPASLVETESGGDWSASNNVTGAGGKAGHFGRLQFGQARLEDAKRAGVIPADMTPDQFMASPNAQMAVEQWHFGDINSRIDAAGLGQYEGQVIGGVPMTRDGMLAMAHLGGFGGLQKFVESNGQYNPADAYGTSLADYGVRHGGGQPVRTAQAGNFDLGTLAELAGNPYASPGQKAVLQALIGQQTAALDPMRALEMQRAQLEIEAMRNPNANVPDAVRSREMLAERAGLQPGTPEFQTYMATGELPKPFATTRIVSGADAAALGLDPAKSYNVTEGPNGLEASAIGGGGTTINNNMGESSELRKELGKSEGKLWGTYLEQGGVSAGTVQDMQLLDELITMAPQGPVSGRLAQAFPGVNSAADAFQSVVKRVAPTLRAPGSGATSDIEYDGMLKSLPQLSSKPEANRAIAAMMRAKAQINIERAGIVQQFQNGEISEGEARRAIQEIDKRSIMTPELSAVLSGLEPSQGPAVNGADDGVPTFNPQTGKWE